MPLPTYYATGTASVDAGATTIAFTGALLGTAELPTFEAGDLFLDPAQPLVPPQRLASVDYGAGSAELWVGWPGTSLDADPYEVRFTDFTGRSTAQTRRYLELLGAVTNTGIAIDAFGPFADRGAYDDERALFAYLSVDGDGDLVDGPVVFLKASATAGDWSEAIPVAGPTGSQGPAGIFGLWRGNYNPVTDYAAREGVYFGGSAWIAKVPTTGNPPPTLPTTSNTWWDIVVAKGDPGDGDGDVLGPAGSVDSRVALFDGVTGKLLKDGGITLAELVTEAMLSAAIDTLVAAAPGQLDTLNELAAALGDDPDFAATMTSALAGKQPLNAGLSSIAALTTTAFGRGLLELANAGSLAAALTALRHDQADQTITGGAGVTTLSLGNLSGATLTIDVGDRPQQRVANNGAGSIVPGTREGSCILTVANVAGAGLVTTTGFRMKGDAFDTTVGSIFRCTVIIDADGSELIVAKVA